MFERQQVTCLIGDEASSEENSTSTAHGRKLQILINDTGTIKSRTGK